MNSETFFFSMAILGNIAILATIFIFKDDFIQFFKEMAKKWRAKK